jgi:DNA invertase Pin-like site-specific DNA recombinase
MNDKITPAHLLRKAMLYIRQSSVHQMRYNQESRLLQYAMKERLEQLGWSEVEMIDEDLGRSAAGQVARSGFERMVAEVSLGRVGAVAARELSRLSRNKHLVTARRTCPSLQGKRVSAHVLRHYADLRTMPTGMIARRVSAAFS